MHLAMSHSRTPFPPAPRAAPGHRRGRRLAPAAASAAPGDLTALADRRPRPRRSPADGAWAAYSALGGNGKRQIFVRNLATGVVTPVTNGDLDSDTSSAANGLGLDISVDGRYVVFDSAATDLVPGLVDANNADDVFRWDRITGAIELVSAGPDRRHRGGRLAPAPRLGRRGTGSCSSRPPSCTPSTRALNAPQVYVRDMVRADHDDGLGHAGPRRRP